MPDGWTCPRVSKGVRCGFKNPPRARKCQRLECGKPRPKKRQAAHMDALKRPYEEYVELNGGDFCGACGSTRDEQPKGRRLDRDHSHTTPPYPRGLLCRKCNRFLVKTRYGLKVTPLILRQLADYLERAEGRIG